MGFKARRGQRTEEHKWGGGKGRMAVMRKEECMRIEGRVDEEGGGGEREEAGGGERRTHRLREEKKVRASSK